MPKPPKDPPKDPDTSPAGTQDLVEKLHKSVRLPKSDSKPEKPK